jgi:predicted metal-dependent phosphoesterase TrpH
MTLTNGLAFQRFDLHVHTPASTDFEGTATAADIVKAACDRGLRGIAITDHQTAAWVDQVKAAAKGTDLVVFPGVEVMATGGDDVPPSQVAPRFRVRR